MKWWTTDACRNSDRRGAADENEARQEEVQYLLYPEKGLYSHSSDKLYFVFKFGVSRYLIARSTRSTAYCKSHVLYCTSATCPSVSCFLPNDSWAGLPLQTWTAYVVKTMDVWINVHKLQKGKYPSRIKKALKIKYNTFLKNYHRKSSKIKC